MPESKEPLLGTDSKIRLRDQLQKRKGEVLFLRVLEKVAPHAAWLGYADGYDGYKYKYGELLPSYIPDNSVIIDLMGPGEFYRDLQRKGWKVSGVALTLADTRNKDSRRVDRKNHNGYVTGDILNRKTWRKLQQQLPAGKADLIVCNPGGGWVNIPKSPNIFMGLLDRAYRLLNVDGRLVTTVPEEFIPQIKAFRDNLKKHGVIADVNISPKLWETSDNPTAELMLQRKSDSPPTLATFITPNP